MGKIPYIWMPSTDGAFRPGRKAYRSIILHHTGAGLQSSLNELRGMGSRRVSAHWLIDRDGTYYHLVQNEDTAFHAGQTCLSSQSNVNSIGIEQVWTTGHWPTVQVQAAANLTAALLHRYGRMGIYSHAEAACPEGRKNDPLGYPWDLYHSMVSEALLEPWDFVEVQRPE